METFKWPVTIVTSLIIFFAFFRQAIIGLIGRSIRIVFGDKSVELTSVQGTAIEQKKEVELPSPATEMVPAAQAMPAPNVVTADIEAEIQTTLQNSNFSPAVERAWLIRTIAMLRVQHAHEVVYRLITGSQIGAMLAANTAVGIDMTRARAMYDAAVISFPDTYVNFPFDTWVNYPVHMGLIRIEPSGTGPNLLRITPRGEDFLHFLVSNNLTEPKRG